MFPAHEVLELLDLGDLPGESESCFETVGGFLVDQLGNIPRAGGHIPHEGYRFEVMDMDGNRVDKILVHRLSE